MAEADAATATSTNCTNGDRGAEGTNTRGSLLAETACMEHTVAEIAVEALDLAVEFDREEGALYISLGVPACGHLDQKPDGLLLRRLTAADRPTGITALDFMQNWLHRRAEFYDLAAGYLDVPVAELAGVAEVVIGANTIAAKPA